MDDHGLSMIIMGRLRIMDYPELFWIVMDYRTVVDYRGRSRITADYRRCSWTIVYYRGLLDMHHHAIRWITIVD